MKVTIRSDSVEIDGYVNAVDRFSRPLFEGAIGQFVEKILPKVFTNAIKRARNVDVLLNHDPSRKLAQTSDGTAVLTEDNIGLRARVTINDPEVIKKARNGKLRGWSFGFTDAEDDRTENKKGIIERTIKSLALHEVSIIDDKLMPVYYGTSIETRAIDDMKLETRASDDTEVDTDEVGGDRKTPTDTATDDATDERAKADAEKIQREQLERERDLRDVDIY